MTHPLTICLIFLHLNWGYRESEQNYNEPSEVFAAFSSSQNHEYYTIYTYDSIML